MFLALALLLAQGTLRATAPNVVVTVAQPAPMESVSATGDVTGVREATVGARYTLVSATDSQVTMQDATGAYRIAIAATDYVPPPVAPPAVTSTAPVTNAAPATATNAAPATSPAAASVAASSGSTTHAISSPAPQNSAASLDLDGSSDSSAPASQDKVDAVNAGLGKPLFTTQSLWSEPALVIAQRLGLGLEGRTKWETSYRRYFSGKASDSDSAMLGTGAYCVALYADADDHPTSVLIAFDNDGDYKRVAFIKSDLFVLDHPSDGGNDHRNFPDKTRDELQKEYDDDVSAFEPDRMAEAATLDKNLSALFGDPRNAMFGDDPATREDIKRWDWNGVSFLLTSHADKYNLLRLVPIALADNNGRAERIPRDEIGEKLSGAVEHRPNGDVVITQLPMADQGPKGFCVPATWERVLRYEGVPGDMYTLSRIGNTGFGGGTWSGNLTQQLDETLHNYGRHTEMLSLDTLDSTAIKHYIDDGVPIFWDVNPAGYKPARERYELADRDKEWDRWKTLLDAAANAKPDDKPLPNDGGHEVLLIGYNDQTKELAWTDPWGRQDKERWMTEKEAQRCSKGVYYIISW